MHGLRRITLNDNRIGDNGARILADALKDDLWLKGMIDLMLCAVDFLLVVSSKVKVQHSNY